MRLPVLLAPALGISLMAPVGLRSSQGPPPQAPVFRSGVELVRVDVRVTDRDGRPIGDLRADEVEVYEEGERRQVLLFQHVQQPVGTYAEVAQRTIASEVSTNQGAPRGHVYVLAFDQTHITAGNEQRARRAAERFLRARVRPGDRVALYALPGPGPQIDFTANTAPLIERLASVTGSREESTLGAAGAMRVSDAYEITRGNEEILTRYVVRYSQEVTATDTVLRTERPGALRGSEDPAVLRQVVTDNAREVVARADGDSRRLLQSLADVVRGLRDVEGRKAVILFSEGFQIDNVRHEVEDVAGAAAQSYCVIYALDLNSRTVDPQQAEPIGGQQYTEIQSRLESLGSLTGATDGVLFGDASPQVDHVLDRISESAQDYYLIGFTPSAASLADRNLYRHIRVLVTRPGAQVGTRAGFAVGPERRLADPRQAIDAALRAPFSQQGLRVEYTTYVLRGTTPDLQRVVMSLAAELPVAAPGAPPAQVVFSARDARDGRVAASGSGAMALPEASAASGTTGTGYARMQFELPAGFYLMRVVVREPGGLIGSADRRFTVRALGGPGLAASDLILGSSDTAGWPVRATVYSSDVLSGVTELYGRTPTQLESAVVDVELLPLGRETPLRRGRADLQPVQTGTLGSSRGARIELPLQDVPPGEYVVRATVRSGSETVAELPRDVMVSSNPKPPAIVEAGPPPLDPAAVLQGEVTRRYLDQIRRRAEAGNLALAARMAGQGQWGGVEAAIPAPAASSPDAQALIGFARFARRDYRAAASAWRACADAGPANAPVAFLLGWAHAGAGDDRAAISAWRIAVLADATLIPAHLALVDAYLRLGQPDLALQVVRSGLSAVPDSVELRDRLSRLTEKRW